MSNRHVTRSDISDIGKAAEETEVQRAVNRQLIQEGRLIRTKELERRRQEEENGYEDLPKVPISNASRYSSLRSSNDNFSSASSTRNTDARDLRAQLLELEEKFKGAMMANVQLDNEKQLLRYEVDLLKDKLEDLHDSNSMLQRAFLEKKRDLAYNRMQLTELNHRLEFARKQIEARDQLLIEHNLVLLGGADLDSVPPLATEDHLESLEDGLSVNESDNKQKAKRSENGVSLVNGDSGIHDSPPTMALISKTTADLLKTLPETKLEAQILHLFSTRTDLLARIEKLEGQLEEERKAPESLGSRYDSRSRLTNGPNNSEWKHELQNIRNQAQEYKYKLQEALQKNSSLESDIVRLEGQIKRYKTIADSCEQQEAELKQERRKNLRELREVQTQLDDSKAENARLQRKLDKLIKAANLSATLSKSSRDSSVQR